MEKLIGKDIEILIEEKVKAFVLSHPNETFPILYISPLIHKKLLLYFNMKMLDKVSYISTQYGSMNVIVVDDMNYEYCDFEKPSNIKIN